MQIIKTLSANDLGVTGTHQAGVHVPKQREILDFFPPLPSDEKNPRACVVVREKASGARWEFNFIYYNNRLFGGTRNEYRLTGVTRFLRELAPLPGDQLLLTKDQNGSIYVELLRHGRVSQPIVQDGVLVLGGGWIVINR